MALSLHTACPFIVFLKTSGNPWHDEGAVLRDQAEAVVCGESYCFLHSTCYFPPCLGPYTLQTGECECACVQANISTGLNMNFISIRYSIVWTIKCQKIVINVNHDFVGLR